jgi:hypothetical protein
MVDDQTPPENPRQEPEILPPDRGGRRLDWTQPPWQTAWSSQARGTHRVYVTRVGPFGFAALMLALALLAVVIFLTIVGAVLIWIPVVALVVIIAAIYRFFRR